jgi:hypothetical protein
MGKPLLQLNANQISELGKQPEAGMGFQIGTGKLSGETEERLLVISGDNYVVPETHPTYFSLSDLVEGEPFPDLSTQEVQVTFSNLMLSRPRSGFVSLPPGYAPKAGAVALLGSVTLRSSAIFYRFVGSAKDPRLTGATLSPNTYLTPHSDIAYANTGFAAVGRYALPLPVPASYRFQYQLLAGTQLQVGTVLPSFGQAGGGVEVRLAVSPPSVFSFGSQTLDDF